MKLHWSPRSPFVRKVMIAAHELGVADKIETVRSVAAMSVPNARLMQDNPLSKIPTLVLPTGEALFDSRTICEYLDAIAPEPRLFPERGPERWRALAWQSLGDGLLDLAILWRNERDKPEDRRTGAWLDAFALKTRSGLDRLEADAADLEAAPFGIGHIAVGCALAYFDFRFPELSWREGRPNLECWAQTFAARASARATEIVDA